jgi:hypothetical protein
MYALLMAVCPGLWAQGKNYVGGMGGFAILSGDGDTQITAGSTATSNYSPQTGPAFNIFAGRHLDNWLSVQANYMYNSNDLTFNAVNVTEGQEITYTQPRSSTQQSFVVDLLLYFRPMDSWIRPYLSTGPGLVHVSSDPGQPVITKGGAAPPGSFTSNVFGVRVAVGSDIALKHGFWFRYSFSETIGENPIADRLTPQGTRVLKNFQNLWGVVKTF